MVDVTMMDDSGKNGAASCRFTAWFPKTSQPGQGDQLKKLMESVDNVTPVAFFNLVSHKEKTMGSASEHTTLKTSRQKFTFEICNEGTKASRLTTNATTVTTKDSSQITVVSELPNFVKQDIDYMAVDSHLTVCRLLHYMMQADPALMNVNSSVFQINLARIIEPKAGEQFLTNDGDRLFPTVRVIDSTGTVELKMRAKAVLELSGVSDKNEFMNLASNGALNFPILSSMRIAVSKRKEDSAAEHAEDRLNWIIVEATEQAVLIPQAVPNASMEYLTQLMISLPQSSNRILAAPMSAVRLLRHGGMVVNPSSSDSAPLQASYVLSLVAHAGRSVVTDLAGGHKLVSKNCWSVPFEPPATKDSGAPEHADKKVLGEIASYCTMDNVQDYTLTARNPKQPVYAMIIISNVHEASDDPTHLTYMVDKVGDKLDEADIPKVRALLRKLAQTSNKSQCQQKLNNTPDWKDNTPYTATKSQASLLHTYRCRSALAGIDAGVLEHARCRCFRARGQCIHSSEKT